jgi:hypothetical protein
MRSSVLPLTCAQALPIASHRASKVIGQRMLVI